VLLDAGTQKVRILNIGAVETSDPIYFLYIIIQGIQIFGLCELRAGVYMPSGWDFLRLGKPLFRRVVQEYMHGPYKEGANSTSVLIIYMLKFSGTSYVIASLATAYLFPIKLILAVVRYLVSRYTCFREACFFCLQGSLLGLSFRCGEQAFPVYHC
jgi:hypothetical protein